MKDEIFGEIDNLDRLIAVPPDDFDQVATHDHVVELLEELDARIENGRDYIAAHPDSPHQYLLKRLEDQRSRLALLEGKTVIAALYHQKLGRIVDIIDLNTGKSEWTGKPSRYQRLGKDGEWKRLAE